MNIPIADITIGKRCRKDLGDLSGLMRSIGEVGLLHPVVVTPDFRLVAGERRLEAARRLGWIEVPVTVAANLSEAVTLLKAERDENTCRKGLDPTERQAHADRMTTALEERKRLASLANLRHAGEVVDRESFPIEEQGRTRDIIASGYGISGRTFEKERAVVKAAERDPETFGDLPAQMDKTGKADKAFGEVKKREKRAALKQAAEAAKETTAFDCRAGDFRTVLADIPDASVPLVFADPRWDDATAEEVYADLFAFANRVLIDGGSLVVYVGHNAIPTVLSKPNPLRYWWTIAAIQDSGRTARLPGKWVLTEWRPLLWFVKGGRRDNEYMVDVIRVSREAGGKDAHDWSQPEQTAAHCIRVLTRPGELVIDPFLGGGTTGLAAVKSARRFIGCDIDAETAEIAKGRIILAKAT